MSASSSDAMPAATALAGLEHEGLRAHWTQPGSVMLANRLPRGLAGEGSYHGESTEGKR